VIVQSGKSASKWVGKWAWRLLEGALVAMTLGIVILVIALSQGPVAISFISGPLAKALDTSPLGISTEIGPCFLVWDRNQRHLGIEVQDLVLRTLPTDTVAARVIARFPKAEAVVSMRGILHGVIAPSRLVISGPSVQLTRNQAGQFTFGIEGLNPADGATAAGGPTFEDMANALVNPVETDTALSFLKSFVVQNAELRVRDNLGAAIGAGRVDIAISRTPIGMAADIDARLDQGGSRPAAIFHLDLTADKPSNALIAHGQIEQLVPAALVALHPDLASISGIDVPVAGSMNFTIGLDGRLQRLGLELGAGEGTITQPDLWPEPKAIKSIRLAGSAVMADRKFLIDLLQVSFGGPSLEAKGTISWLDAGGSPGLNLDITAHNLTVPDVVALWPLTAAPGGRRWIAANMDRGTIAPFKAKLAIADQALDNPNLPSDAISVEFGFQDLRTRYLGALPPLEGADGTAKLTATTLEIYVNKGKVGALDAADGRVSLSGFDKPVSMGTVGLTLSGTMAETLRILNFEPLGYPNRFGIDAPSVGGRQSLRVSVQLPLIDTVTMSQTALKVEGKIFGLGLKHLVGSRDLTGGDLSLQLDNAGLEAKGIGRLEGVPLAITWKEDFNAVGKPSSRFLVSGILDDKDRDRLGVSTDWRARGPIGARVELIGRGPEILSGKAELNLDSTLIDYPELDLLRLPDQPGNATFDIAFPADGIRLSNIQVKAGEVSAKGDIFFSKAGQIMSLKLSPLLIGDRADLDVAIKRTNDGRSDRLNFDVSGRKFDATGLLDWIGEPDEPGSENRPGTPFAVDAKVTRVVLADEAPPIRNVTLTLNSDGLKVTGLKAEADVGTSGRLDMTIGPKDAQHRRLHIRSTDAGAALETIDIFDEGSGGTLSVDGIYDDRTPNGPLTGVVEMKDLRIVKAPVLFQLLILASVEGALDTLQGTGILFGTSKLNFRSQDGRIYLSEGLFSGPMVALTLSGLVDQRVNALELKGALVPLSRINSLLGGIPLIGDLIVGRKGEGIIGIDYAITGPSAAPRISVNPLSVLAPSFLKRIFDIGQPEAPKN
jgi:hypothetical protein